MEFIHAIDNNDIEYVNHLINNTDVNVDSAPYPTENTALNYAAIYNNLDIVKLLVKAGANLEIVNEDGETPLYNAALHGNIEIVKFLIESGANINAVDGISHYTPLHIAIFCPGYGLDMNDYKNYFNIATLLIKSGANLNIESSQHRTPLHTLVNSSIKINVDFDDEDANELHKDVIKIAKLLIQGGANVNAVDRNGNTPLHFAFKIDVADNELMRDNDFELAYILLEAGANNRLFNNDLGRPFDVAFDDDLTRFGEFLKKKNVTKKYSKMLTKKIRTRAMRNVRNKVDKTLVRSRKIPSYLAPSIAEYVVGSGKRTRRRRPNKKRKKRKRSKRS